MRYFINTLFVSIMCLAPYTVHAQTQGDSADRKTITKVGTTAAQFLKLGVGARPIALGGTYVAQANDLSAMYWNPAGLSKIDGAAVQFAHTEYLADINYSFAAFGFNMGNMGTLAASVTLLTTDDMEVRTVRKPEGTGEFFKVQDFALQLSYARSLTDRFSIGGSFKLIQERIWHSTASSIAIDIGTLFTTPYERLRLGASFSNFGPKMQMSGRDIIFSDDPSPNIDGNVEIVNAEYLMEQFSLPLLFRIGLSWDAFVSSDHRFVISTDAAHPNDNSEYLNFGAEYDFRDLIAFRIGYRNLLEVDGEQGLTFGGGLNIRIDRSLRARFDYAYADFGRLEQTHWFTVDLSF